MCYNKLRILNKVKPEHESGFDKYRISVQCGKCPACRKQRSKDWMFRTFFEFKDFNKPVYFVTLTYDDDNLPRYKGKPCFDQEHIRYFFARLRKRIGPFRYFRAAEYGGFTHRPHNHFLIAPANGNLDFNTVATAIHLSWWYGCINRIDYISNNNGNFLKTIRYISEYTTKDINFDVEVYEKDIPSRYCQRVNASKGYGSSFLKLLDFDTLKRGFYYLPVGKNGILVRFSIPRYYEIKLCFDYHWNKDESKAELIKNNLGLKIALHRHNSHYVHNIDSFFSSRNVDLMQFTFLKPKVLELGCSYKDAVLNCFKDFDDFKDFIYFRDFISVSDSIPELKIDPVFGDVFSSDFMSSGYYIDTLSNSMSYHPKWKYYEKVFSIYLEYRQLLNNVKCRLESEKLIQACKARTRSKIRRDPRLRRYLINNNINISKFYS